MKIMLSADFDYNEINKSLREVVDRVQQVTLNQLKQVGLQVVRDARSKIPTKEYHLTASEARVAAKLVGGSINLSSADGFNDDTGNLRSSIGFIILYDGQIVHREFKLSTIGTDKTTGLDHGVEYAEKLGTEHTSGWVLIIVAGMEYASWVEALGYDVITGSTLGAQNSFEKALVAALNEIVIR
jgi:hypothetical protein